MNGIFLDIGWTLCYPPSGDWLFSNECSRYIDKNVLNSIPKERLESAYSRALQFLDDNHLVLTEKDEFTQFTAYYGMLADSLPELGLSEKSIEEMTEDKVYNTSNYTFYDDVIPVLLQLKEKYKLGIISDTWPSMKRVLENFGIYNYFDSITFSCNLGVLKPNGMMYEHAIRSLGLPPEETVFVDDTIDNLKGAGTYGIVSMLIERDNYPRKQPQTQFRSISSLSELIGI